MWHAVVQPRHVHGLLLGCGPRLAVYGGPSDAGPWTADWSTVDRVHPSSPRRGPCTPGARAGARRGGCSPIFPAAVLLPTVSFAMSLLWQRWCSIRVGKSFLSLWRLRRWGQGGGRSFPRHWPRRSAARASPACTNGASDVA
jgi:hypothetical protein